MIELAFFLGGFLSALLLVGLAAVLDAGAPAPCCSACPHWMNSDGYPPSESAEVVKVPGACCEDHRSTEQLAVWDGRGSGERTAPQ